MSTSPFPRFRSWRGGVLRWATYLFAAGVLAVVGVFAYQSWMQKREWAEALAEADRLDPGWRLSDIEAKRLVLADHENSALLVQSILKRDKFKHIDLSHEYDAIFKNLTPTARLNVQQDQFVRSGLAKVETEVRQARRLKDIPLGRYPESALTGDIATGRWNVVYSDQVVPTWLLHDAMLRAEDGDYEGAAESAEALLNAARSVGDEPVTLSQIVRIAGQRKFCKALERILAQGTLTAVTLERLMRAIEREGQEPTLVQMLREERARHVEQCERAMAGDSDGGLDSFLRERSPWPMRHIRAYRWREMSALIREDNRRIEAETNPEQAKERPRPRDARDADFPNGAGELLIAVERVTLLSGIYRTHQEGQAALRTGLVAIACERYRQEHGRWPADVKELMAQKILPSIPLDPFDDERIRIVQKNDGLVIYSVGSDRRDDGGLLIANSSTEGCDVGFRLWDVDKRRQPPLPPVALPVDAVAPMGAALPPG